mgnify:CR=1 FL=1
MANKYTHFDAKYSDIDSGDFANAIDMSYESMKDETNWHMAPGSVGELIDSDGTILSDAKCKRHLKSTMLGRMSMSGQGQWDSDGWGTPFLLCMKETDTNKQLYYQSGHSNPDNPQEVIIDASIFGQNTAGSRGYLKTDVPEIRKSFRKWLGEQGYTSFDIKVDQGAPKVSTHMETYYATDNDADAGAREEETRIDGRTIKHYKMTVPSGE